MTSPEPRAEAEPLDLYLRYLAGYFGASREISVREGDGACAVGQALAAEELGAADARERRVARSAEELLSHLKQPGPTRASAG